jgi:arylsulfatase A-like enzyme
MTGLYQTSIGVQNHRSHREDGYQLPKGVHLITDYLREAGYFTANLRKAGDPRWGSGKNDFNFQADKPFDGTHWNQRAPGQPFYAQVSFNEPKPGDWADNATLLSPEQRVNPADLELPPYWPDHPIVRKAFGNYLDALARLDGRVGFILDQLEADGLTDNTIIIFFADHGRAMVRCKQWLYDGGIHIPLIIRFPDGRQAGTVRTELVSAIDITATTLRLAGIKPPANLEGRVFLGDERDPPREYVVAARDRCDETVDRIRCVRTKRFKYIRNFMPQRPYTQLNRYVEQKFATMSVLRQLHSAGKLTPEQALFMAPRRPEEELYDLQSDPYEVHNLSSSSQHSARLRQMRAILDEWIARTGDQGAIAEDPRILEKWDEVMQERHPLPPDFETGGSQH